MWKLSCVNLSLSPELGTSPVISGISAWSINLLTIHHIGDHKIAL